MKKLAKLTICMVLLFPGYGFSADVSIAERVSLLRIFQSTNGAEWNDNFGWNSTLGVCDWSKVICTCELDGETCSEDEVSNVARLLLSDNNLDGELPEVFESFVQLDVLNISFNNLKGRLPESIGSMWSLQGLYAGFNSFSGDLHSSMLNLVNLREVNLHFNALYTADTVMETFINQRLIDDPASAGFLSFQALDVHDLTFIPGRTYINFEAMKVGVEVSLSEEGVGNVVILGSDNNSTGFVEMKSRVENGNYVIEDLTPETVYFFKAVRQLSSVENAGIEGARSTGDHSNTIEVLTPKINDTSRSQSGGGGGGSGGSLNMFLMIMLGGLFFRKFII